MAKTEFLPKVLVIALDAQRSLAVFTSALRLMPAGRVDSWYFVGCGVARRPFDQAPFDIYTLFD